MPDDEYVRIGVIAGVHGLAGRLKIFVTTDIMERFSSGNQVYLEIENKLEEFEIIEFIKQKNKSSLVKLKGIEDRDTAFSLKGVEIFIEKQEAENTRHLLGEDDFYYYDIIGSSAYIDNKLFGDVVDILEAGGGDILIITDSNGRKFMVPFVESMVDTSDIKSKKIHINPVEGLFDL